mgnify:CR=1 FL=1
MDYQSQISVCSVRFNHTANIRHAPSPPHTLNTEPTPKINSRSNRPLAAKLPTTAFPLPQPDGALLQIPSCSLLKNFSATSASSTWTKVSFQRFLAVIAKEYPIEVSSSLPLFSSQFRFTHSYANRTH